MTEFDMIGAWLAIGFFVVFDGYVTESLPVIHRAASRLNRALNTGDGAEGFGCVLTIVLFAMVWPLMVFFKKWR